MATCSLIYAFLLCIESSFSPVAALLDVRPSARFLLFQSCALTLRSGSGPILVFSLELLAAPFCNTAV